MQRQITQRELRNNSGRIMRALDAGESFLVTRNGVAVGQITPVRGRAFTPKEQVLELFKTAPKLACESVLLRKSSRLTMIVARIQLLSGFRREPC